MNTPTEATRNELRKIVSQHVDALSEFFQNVEILVSNVEEGGDQMFFTNHGTGNRMARLQHMRDILTMEDERLRVQVRQDLGDDEDDDDD